jgi:hypothetical protein
MSAVIVPFRTARKRPDAWAIEDVSECYRIVDSLARVGMALTLERGESDEGDPWIIFVREDTQDVLIHLARIDGEVIAASIASEHMFRGRSLREVLRRILQAQPFVLPPTLPVDAGDRILMHPATMLAAVLATAFVHAGQAEAAVTLAVEAATDGIADEGGAGAVHATGPVPAGDAAQAPATSTSAPSTGAAARKAPLPGTPASSDANRTAAQPEGGQTAAQATTVLAAIAATAAVVFAGPELQGWIAAVFGPSVAEGEAAEARTGPDARTLLAGLDHMLADLPAVEAAAAPDAAHAPAAPAPVERVAAPATPAAAEKTGALVVAASTAVHALDGIAALIGDVDADKGAPAHDLRTAWTAAADPAPVAQRAATPDAAALREGAAGQPVDAASRIALAAALSQATLQPTATAAAPAAVEPARTTAPTVHLGWADLYREGAVLLDTLKPGTTVATVTTGGTATAVAAKDRAEAEDATPAAVPATGGTKVAAATDTVTVAPVETVAAAPVAPVPTAVPTPIPTPAPAAASDVLVIRTPADMVATTVAIFDFTWGGRHDVKATPVDVVLLRLAIDANPVVAGADRVLLARGGDATRDAVMLMPGVAMISVDAVAPALAAAVPAGTLKFQFDQHAVVTLVGVIDI